MVVVLPLLKASRKSGVGGLRIWKVENYFVFLTRLLTAPDLDLDKWVDASAEGMAWCRIPNLTGAFCFLRFPQHEDGFAGGGVRWVTQHRKGSLEEAQSVRC